VTTAARIIARAAALGWRGLLLAGCLVQSSWADTPAAPTPARTPTSEEFGTAIKHFDALDPNSPAALSAHLAYAEFLVQPGPDQCREDLAAAQEQVDLVARSHATEVIFSGAWARRVDVQYRIDRARASCTRDPVVRARELQAALEEATRATGLYRETLNYRSMIIMQFNIGATHHELGDDTAAATALESAIELDREYGWRSDAEDNYRRLLTWKREPADKDRIAALMQDFPNRSLSLKFGWAAGDATVVLDRALSYLANGAVVSSHVARTLERQVRAVPGGWTLSFIGGADASGFGVWPSDSKGTERIAFPPALTLFPTIELTATGDFKTLHDVDGFARHTLAEAQTDIRTRAPKGVGGPVLEQALEAARNVFAPEVIQAQTSEDYSLQTAMWIGASLDQGARYEIYAPLLVAGLPGIITSHRLEFTFTRRVPCGANSADRACAEMVIRAVPEEEALENLLQQMQGFRYESSTLMRIVIDPATLLPYAHETYRYWYLASDKSPASGSLLESERFTMHSEYH
jgi:hypothetical protein